LRPKCPSHCVLRSGLGRVSDRQQTSRFILGQFTFTRWNRQGLGMPEDNDSEDKIAALGWKGKRFNANFEWMAA
jgi:hypothetical protein